MGIPTIKDRLIQKCLEQLLTPYFENIFSEWRFGFRTKKACHDAIKRVKQRKDELEIIRTYKTIVRGIIQYFCWTNNLGVLTHLSYRAEYSCLKTLARKRKTSIARVRMKCKIGST
ncbi:MAG: group II intron reverse transcriptase/maturase [Candidatus Phytoplasma australasiaticum]|nr:group II intron reverse transcriptase/maturase [Candidatus Phytoplasma australasiaticum]